MKFKELLSKGQEALDALKVPFQNALAENNLNAEIIKLIGRLRYRASYGQNALAHTLEVAHLAGGLHYPKQHPL